jgi:hypothetical protein
VVAAAPWHPDRVERQTLDGEVYEVNLMYLLPAHWVGIRVWRQALFRPEERHHRAGRGRKGARLKGTSEKLSNARCQAHIGVTLLSVTA